ncbi:MAG: c-type cytochrome [Planctomycetales bacterium]|nr:c-type cytochrome [Planctomycetales bacterium]
MGKLVTHIVLAILIPSAILLAIDGVTHRRLGNIRLANVDASAGKRIFGKNCLRCHNLETNPYQKMGPNLLSVRSRQHVVNGQTLSIPEYVLQSIIDPDAYQVSGFGVMPKNVVSHLSNSDIRDLVAYVAGPSHDQAVAKLEIPPQAPAPEQVDITLAEAELGEAVLRGKGKCLTCHSYYQAPEYHSLAPNLLTGAYKDIEAVKKHIMDPSAKVADEYKLTTVVTADGLVFTGRRVGDTKRTDELRLLVANADGNYDIVTLAMDDIETDDDGKPILEVRDGSPMPADFTKLLTPQEIDAVAKLISSLNE